VIDQLAAERSSLLDLCCGGGRLLTGAAGAGCDVVGVDLSNSMINRARRRLEESPAIDPARVRLVQADALTLDLGTTFDAVALGGLTATLFDPAERASLLASVRRHLRPGGTMFLDYSPVSLVDQATSGQVTVPIKRRDERGFYIVEWRRDPRTRLCHVSLFCEFIAPSGASERNVGGFTYHLFEEAELRAELKEAGFDVIADISKGVPEGVAIPETRWLAATALRRRP
jgi:SAM-dependent methyltransferase